MIDAFYPVVDRVTRVLAKDGIFGVVDFYVSGRTDNENIARQCNWFTRWFWAIWFDFDHINLHPSRRNYLEHKFETVKSVSFRNHFVIPYVVRIPYYIW